MFGGSIGGSGCWVVTFVVVAAVTILASVVADEVVEETTNSNITFEEQFKQVVWKKCALQLTPTCLKLTLVRLVDRLSQDTLYRPLPGVTLSSNRSNTALEPPAASSRGDLSVAERLDEYLRHRVNSYLHSLTLTVKPFDLPMINATDVVDEVTGRKKDGVGLGAVALMMGGAMMAMMMSALAAMAGKAMMTSMMALMLAVMSSMKHGGGGGKSTTYEVIAQPHHSDHGWRRSVDVAPSHSTAQWGAVS